MLGFIEGNRNKMSELPFSQLKKRRGGQKNGGCTQEGGEG